MKRLVIIGALVASLAILLAPPLIMASSFGWVASDDPQDWGAFGGFISGTSGVIVTILGFLAVIFTILKEQARLKVSEEESQALRLEKRLHLLLETLADMLAGTELRGKKTGRVIASGRSAFRNFFLKKFVPIYERVDSEIVDERLVVQRSFDELYRRHGSQFGHYFRTLYHCFLVVDDPRIDLNKKKEFADLIMCRLSKFEIVMLMYNCLGTVGSRKFKGLVEKYGLLEHLDLQMVLDNSHIEFFNDSAFARSIEELRQEINALDEAVESY